MSLNEGEFTLDILEGEQVLFVGLSQNLVELARRLGTELVARLYELRWCALTSHERSRSVKHRVWATGPIVKGTGLRINKHFLSRAYRWLYWILNHFHSWLKLIRHLLLCKNII